MISLDDGFVLREARKFIDPKFGLIKYLVNSRRNMGESHYFHSSCRITNLNRVLEHTFSPDYSTNASMNKTRTEISAIAEALERYCAIMKNFEEEHIYTSVHENTQYNLFPLDNAPKCTDEEYRNRYNPLSKPDKKQKYHWTKCLDLINQKEVYVPSPYIFLQFQIQSKKELINTPNSTATAGGQTIEEASVNAILEALERDAIMVTWLNQLPRRRIRTDALDHDGIPERIKAIQKMGVEIFLFDISTDFNIPVILCILHSKVYPYFTVAAAAKVDPFHAISRALDEGYTTRKYALYNHENFNVKNYYKDYRNVINYEDHIFLFNKPNMQDKLDFLLQSTETTAAESMPHDAHLNECSAKHMLDYFIQEFKNREMNLVIKDITTSDIATSIFKFVKVFAPELVWLTPNHNYRFLDNKRIKECLPKIGYESHLSKKITDVPHPFA
jgi:ribosomal protein S12 methylthiotransferase accessory factor